MQEEDNRVWPPAPTVAPPEFKARPPSKLRPFLFPLMLSLAMGVWDACSAESGVFANLKYVFAGAVLGFVAPSRARIWGFLLAFFLYFVHTIAILCGVKPPYVEPFTDDALGCFVSLVPAYAGVYAGVGIKKLMEKKRTL